MSSDQEKKTVSLVLGSGGARGIAHVGVIRWLEEHGYDIQSISGCSMGALVGAVYAAGRMDEYEEWARAINRLEIVSMLDIAWSKSGLVRGDRIINKLVDLVGHNAIEELPITYTAVAADVKRQREVWIQTGPLFDAVRASISMPLLFTPFKRNGVELIDGGVLNPVPIAPTFSDNTAMTIAVDASGPMLTDPPIASGMLSTHKPSSSLQRKVHDFVEQLKTSVGAPGAEEWEAFDICHQAFDAMQSTIARQKLAASPPDKTVVIPRNLAQVLDFHRADELIQYGYDQAEKSINSH